MRRVLLGGLGIALGVLVRPAVAQDVPGRAAPAGSTAHSPTQRAARLGRPVATPTATPPATATPVAAPAAAPVTTGVTPAGLTVPGQAPTAVQPATQPAPVWVPAPTPMPSLIQGTPTTGGQVPGGTPTVTMIRDAANGGAAPPVGFPGAVPGIALVPPVGPLDCGDGCVVPCPDAGPACAGPACAAPACLAPQFPALDRLMRVRNDRYWLSAEYLLWWTRSTQFPPLVATGVVDPTGQAGIIAQQPLLAGSFGQTLHSGARFGAGWWFNDDQCRGLDARYFFLGRNGTSFTANSNQYPTLFLPFFNVNTPVGPTGNLVAAPGVATGAIAVDLQNSLWGAEANYRRFLTGNCFSRLDGLVGYRYLNFSEQLTITETASLLPTAPFSFPSGTITDRFRTENVFHGGQIGLTGEARRGRWFVNGRGTVAFGTVFQSAEINGAQTRLLADGTVSQTVGGLYAQPGTNIGRYTQNKFAVLPELGVNLGYHITPNLRVFGGYNFLYLSSVLRPANVIDPNIDAARIPFFAVPGSPAPLAGVARPAPLLNTTDFWTQGLTFGLQWLY